MNAAVTTRTVIPEGGHYAGRININDRPFALIVAPRDGGEFDSVIWNRSTKMVEGAVSFCDGLANTQAMAAAGSAVAKKVLALTIAGYSDWYIPALDELEICYRAFKPTADQNYLWSRSGINVSALPPTYPYTKESPAQTGNEAFHLGGPEAFSPAHYWSSTQRASISGGAWGQGFGDGVQDFWRKDGRFRVRVVRRSVI